LQDAKNATLIQGQTNRVGKNARGGSSIDGIPIALKPDNGIIGSTERIYILNSYIQGNEQGGSQ
jgi:hypothetical protein